MPTSFDPGVYEQISYDDLLIYAVWNLQNEGTKIDWHDVVARAYELFPERFGLPNYTNKYPDSSQVDRSLLRCRDKGFLTGQRARGYGLTNKGLEAVETVSKKLNVQQEDSQGIRVIKAHKKSRAGRIISHIKVSPAYKKYHSEKQRESVTEYDVCSMLLCSLDTPTETRRKNLAKFRDEAGIGKWEDVVEFLDWIEKRFPALFKTDEKAHKGIYG